MSPAADRLPPAAVEAAERIRQRWRQLTAIPYAGPAIKVVLAYLLLVELATQALFGRVDLGFAEFGRYDIALPRELFLNGAVVGSLYGLVAFGLILVYRANRIVNFAQAQLGAVPATLALMLIAFKGWPYLTVIPIVIVGAILLGALVEVAFIRRFSHAPRLILTVVTIGVGLILQVVEFFTKDWLSQDILGSAAANFTTPFARFVQPIGALVFTGDHLFTVVVVAVIAVALGAFFKYTDIGIAVRASAENGDRASLLGIPVKRVSTVVWVIAAVLSAVGVFLRAPIVGLPITGFVGPAVLLFGLAAAVIARMQSLPMALAAGMFIGIVDRSAVFATRRAALAQVVVFAVIVLALLVQRGQLARAFSAGVETWQAARDYRPIPAELRDLPIVRRAIAGGWAALAVLVALTPWLVGDAQTGLATVAVIYAIIGVSLVILTGWTGQISLGQFAIAGIGAAVAGGLAANHSTDFFLTVLAGGGAGALIAVAVGLPALRIQGLFLAVTTLAFAFAVPDFVLSREFFGWLLPADNAFAERPVLYGRFDFTQDSELLGITVPADAKFFYLCVAFLAIALYLARSLRRYRSGRILIGVRDNERMMQAFGVNLSRTRLTAFAISGFIAAMAGSLLVYQRGSVQPTGFPAEESISVFLMTVIGGVASLPGAILGAVYLKMLPLLPVLRDLQLIELITSGLGVLLILLVLPGGLAQGAYQLRDSFLRWVAAREGIHVPSLIADSRVEGPVADAAGDTAVVTAGAHAASGHRPAADTVRCPVCEALLPLAQAPLHEHLAPVSTNGDHAEPAAAEAPTPDPATALAGTSAGRGAGRSRRARGGRR